LGPTQKAAMNVISQVTLEPCPDKLLKTKYAGVMELADIQDLKSWAPQGACGFESRPRHFSFKNLQKSKSLAQAGNLIEIRRFAYFLPISNLKLSAASRVFSSTP
jgi:hypothetical protein